MSLTQHGVPRPPVSTLPANGPLSSSCEYIVPNDNIQEDRANDIPGTLIADVSGRVLLLVLLIAILSHFAFSLLEKAKAAERGQICCFEDWFNILVLRVRMFVLSC